MGLRIFRYSLDDPVREYGGVRVDQARRMKDLERENTRLRRTVSDLTLDKLILQKAARGNY